MKYDINNFYVGELYLSCQFGNLLYLKKQTTKEKEEREKYLQAIFHGAIDFQHHYHTYIDWNLRRHYNGILTIFYKIGDEHYLCLHNHKIYSNKDIDFYENLIPFIDLLPKIGYCIPKSLSFKESLKLFDSVLKKQQRLSYDNSFIHFDDLYLGNLNLCEGYEKSNFSNKQRYQYCNVPQKYMLFASNTYSHSGFSRKDDSYLYHYGEFYCLFLKEHEQMYNLNNFQYYHCGTLDSLQNDESFCDRVIPFSLELEKSRIIYKKLQLTVPKALKLQKELYDSKK